MKTVLQRLVRYTGLSCALAGLFTLPAQAVITLSLTPSAQSIYVGDTALVDLQISGLGTTELGAWYVELDFNTAILDVTTVTFSGYFSDSNQFFGPSLFSPLTIDETANLGSTLLSGNGTYTLATIAFKGLMPGISAVDWTDGGAFMSLSDQTGQISYDFDVGDLAEIEVLARPTNGVPDTPVTLPLIAVTGLLLAFRRRGRRMV